MRRPVIFEGDALGPAEAEPATAPPVPEPDVPVDGAAMVRATRAAGGRGRGRLARLAWAAAGALLSMALGVAVWDFVTGLLERNAVLGSVALALAGVLGVALVVVVVGELAAILRLGRIAGLQVMAADPEARRDRARALEVSRALIALYRGREELRLPSEALQARQAEILDADALLAASEMALLAPLDEQARREVENAARTVAAATALVPLALADVAVAMTANLRMIRRIAQIYGGRAGALGSWRLLRGVARHLIATGAVAVGDDMISSVLGGSALSRISRRFGEGVINGTLTARVGLAAIEVCRPMRFEAARRPRVSRMVSRALTGLFGQAG